MTNTNKKATQRGAVSLFIVVFAALLITVVTVGFIRLMLADQRQATANDLSQSAYDSAQAGVEDAKRAILRYQNVCSTGTVKDCQDAYAVISNQNCNQGLVNVVSGTTGDEVKVQQTTGDITLDQAYTCVIIQPETDDYLGSLSPNGSKVIPLKSKSTVSTVMVEWYDRDNITNANFNVDLLPTSSVTQPLFNQTTSGWGPNRPSIMRTQLMQFGTSFSLTDFDDTNSTSQSNANTLFLYPVGIAGTALPANTPVGQLAFTQDIRKTPTGSPTPVVCSGNLGAGGYSCRVKITLPTPVGAGDRTAFLRLSALYNATNYRVTLLTTDATGALQSAKFDGVQPSIDSTGRANDLFRRVVTRVEPVDTSFAYPEAAVDMTGNLCKNFAVTNNPADYYNTCTP